MQTFDDSADGVCISPKPPSHLLPQPTLREGYEFGKSHVQDTFCLMDESLMVQLSNNSLSDFVRQVVSGYRNKCETKNVSMVLDLEEVTAPYDRKLVHRAVTAMVENAIDAMPEGGELEATLVNAEYQWELEIADSGKTMHEEACTSAVLAGDAQNDGLPRVLGTETNVHMGVLNQLSILMNATVQSWNCPLGGTAHVLVVPKPATPSY